MKKLFLLFFCIVILFSDISAQQCGGSTRRIKFDFEGNVKKPEKIFYKLFYLMPKRSDRYIGYSSTEENKKELLEFVSNFVYDNQKTPDNPFWLTYSSERFITAPKEKSEKYAAGYIGNKLGYDGNKAHNFKDFEGILFSAWREHHLPQLRGHTCNGILEFSTIETDTIPFLMQIEAEGFETLYFVSNFLGGCFIESSENKPSQRIQMHAKKK